ncbi:hypothetical protein BO71DRAFT_242611 [Aspergillus ellipticus CBS 707.79]|uniref:Uncharacterized protein n=1 Tax=Aspergillus ellipticus CBS 707.79 TaxID=1448320 RepID=A0A319D9Z0_9EURO|nr:hypothetical protein BO71DRAFT_242611 [Aspergillus ellipticus CBS 707.79]
MPTEDLHQIPHPHLHLHLGTHKYPTTKPRYSKPANRKCNPASRFLIIPPPIPIFIPIIHQTSRTQTAYAALPTFSPHPGTYVRTTTTIKACATAPQPPPENPIPVRVHCHTYYPTLSSGPRVLFRAEEMELTYPMYLCPYLGFLHRTIFLRSIYAVESKYTIPRVVITDLGTYVVGRYAPEAARLITHQRMKGLNEYRQVSIIKFPR